jgi:hypothetical protein
MRRRRRSPLGGGYVVMRLGGIAGRRAEIPECSPDAAGGTLLGFFAGRCMVMAEGHSPDLGRAPDQAKEGLRTAFWGGAMNFGGHAGSCAQTSRF